MSRRSKMARYGAYLFAIAALPGIECARAPQGGAGGTRLVVTLRFSGPVRGDLYQYFFLIRNGNDQSGQNGPIAVIRAPYGGNGFATSSNPGSFTAAFTDFVKFGPPQVTSSGYAVYHLRDGLAGDPNRNVFELRGEPELATPPQGGNTVQFEIAIDRLRAAAGELDPTNDTRRYLQINVVATTTTPANSQVDDPFKVTDAFGDQRPGSGTQNKFLTIDTAQIGFTYRSDNPAADLLEPEDDPFSTDGRYDPAVDLLFWSVQIKG